VVEAFQAKEKRGKHGSIRLRIAGDKATPHFEQKLHAFSCGVVAKVS